MSRLCWALALLVLAGCKGGTGVGAGGMVTASGPMPQVDATRATWQLVDLASGASTPLAVAPDPADPALTDRYMLFRYLPPGLAAQLGQAPGTFARQDDEPLRPAVLSAVYIAVFETTRAQWLRIAGSAPWAVPAVAAVDGGGGMDLPATGLGAVPVAAALAAWNAGHAGALSLPSDEVWEVAARAGTATTFPWGEDRSLAVVAQHAVVREGAAAGPAAVGRRRANALGLHDMVGNAWELTAGGWARGGSWADALALARPANRRAVPDDGWATVGVRLVWRP
jgi:formylglycine-generating enzyme required for sulfatase activity